MSLSRDLRVFASNVVGPGVGEIFYLVTNRTTDKYYLLLNKRRVSESSIFTTLASAYAAMTAGQNDTLLVFPGDHVITSEVTWAKDGTNIVGVGSKNQRHQPSTLTAEGVRITCKTAAVSYCITVSGKYVQMFDIGTFNSAAATTNLGDIHVTGRNFSATRCAFRGGNEATQVQSATSGIPVTISTDAYGFKFTECEIGSAGNTTRTTGPGFVRFASGAGGAGLFDRCAFSMRSETTGANASGFTVEQTSLDRLLTFRTCTFYNFSENWGALPDYMFNIDQTTTFDIVLHVGCCMAGFDIVSDSARVKTSDPLPHTNVAESLAVATS